MKWDRFENLSTTTMIDSLFLWARAELSQNQGQQLPQEIDFKIKTMGLQMSRYQTDLDQATFTIPGGTSALNDNLYFKVFMFFDVSSFILATLVISTYFMAVIVLPIFLAAPASLLIQYSIGVLLSATQSKNSLLDVWYSWVRIITCLALSAGFFLVKILFRMDERRRSIGSETA